MEVGSTPTEGTNNLKLVLMDTNNIVRRIGTRLEISLEDQFPEFRRIWVQYTRVSKRRSEYSMVITLFPADGGPYNMIFSGLVSEVNFETTSNLIQEHLDGTD